MPTRLASLSGLLCVAVLVVSAPVPEPIHMLGNGPGRNLVNLEERNIPSDWSVKKGHEKNLLWKAKIGDMVLGSPVVAEGKVFIGTDNRFRSSPAEGNAGLMMCFEQKTGKLLWQTAHKVLDMFEYECTYESGFIASTPAVENGRLYYVTPRAELICAATQSGKILWSLDMIKELKVHPSGLMGGKPGSSPLILNNLVIVGTSNGPDSQTRTVKSPTAPSLVAVNKTTGKVVWKDASPGADIFEGQWSSPAAAMIDGRWQVIHGYGDGWLRGLDAATGRLLWKFHCNPGGVPFKESRRESRCNIHAIPVVHENRVYVAVGLNPNHLPVGVGHLWCIDPTRTPANRERDLSPVGNDFDPKSPRNKNSGLLWHVGGEIMPNPKDSDERRYHFGRTTSSVAVHKGLVYIAESYGFLLCFDAVTGQRQWVVDLEDSTWSSPYCVDGKVFIGTEIGDVHVFAQGKTLKRLGCIDMQQPLRSPPVAADGTLFFATCGYLYAIKMKAP